MESVKPRGIPDSEITGCAVKSWVYVKRVNWQQVVSLIIVAGAAAGLLWGVMRRRKFRFERDTHCGCATSAGEHQGSIVFHARKGQKPEVLVKMK